MIRMAIIINDTTNIRWQTEAIMTREKQLRAKSSNELTTYGYANSENSSYYGALSCYERKFSLKTPSNNTFISFSKNYFKICF